MTVFLPPRLRTRAARELGSSEPVDNGTPAQVRSFEVT
jgi:hypothetical protein